MFCMMQSKRGAEILMDYCARHLDPASRAEIERHLENCNECRRVVEAQRELWETLDRWSPPEVSENFDTRLYARIAREEAEPAWQRWARRLLHPAAPLALWKPVASVAAACAVLAVALTVHPPDHKTPGPQVHAESVDIEKVAKTLDDLDFLAPQNPM